MQYILLIKHKSYKKQSFRILLRNTKKVEIRTHFKKRGVTRKAKRVGIKSFLTL